MPHGWVCADASVTGVPPALGTFTTVPAAVVK
jgi:hypothetical protein